MPATTSVLSFIGPPPGAHRAWPLARPHRATAARPAGAPPPGLAARAVRRAGTAWRSARRPLRPGRPQVIRFRRSGTIRARITAGNIASRPKRWCHAPRSRSARRGWRRRPADQHAEAAGPVGGPLARQIVLGQGEDHALVVHHVRACSRRQPRPVRAGIRAGPGHTAGGGRSPGAGQRRRDGVAARRDDPDEQEFRGAASTSTLCAAGTQSGNPDATAMARRTGR